MPLTQTSTVLSTTVAALDDFIPEETYLTLNEALLVYGLTSNEEITLTNDSWYSISNSPTTCGLLKLSKAQMFLRFLFYLKMD